MANYIDGYYGHQSVTVEAIGIYNSVHLRAKRKLLKNKAGNREDWKGK